MMISPAKCVCTGGIGSLLAAICCFTPVLAFALAGLGLGWLTVFLDLVLLPLLALSLGLLAAGLWAWWARSRDTIH
jgi:mercuric ion transport protein